MEMRRRSNGISGSADIANRITRHYRITFLESPPSIEMRVVVNLTSWSEHVDDEPAKSVRSHPHHYSLCGARYGGAASRKNVDSFMRAASTTRCAPCVGNIPLSHTIYWNVEGRWRTRGEQSRKKKRMAHRRIRENNQHAEKRNEQK
jgi:hypothetical protein